MKEIVHFASTVEKTWFQSFLDDGFQVCFSDGTTQFRLGRKTRLRFSWMNHSPGRVSNGIKKNKCKKSGWQHQSRQIPFILSASVSTVSKPTPPPPHHCFLQSHGWLPLWVSATMCECASVFLCVSVWHPALSCLGPGTLRRGFWTVMVNTILFANWADYCSSGCLNSPKTNKSSPRQMPQPTEVPSPSTEDL